MHFLWSLSQVPRSNSKFLPITSLWLQVSSQSIFLLINPVGQLYTKLRTWLVWMTHSWAIWTRAWIAEEEGTNDDIEAKSNFYFILSFWLKSFYDFVSMRAILLFDPFSFCLVVLGNFTFIYTYYNRLIFTIYFYKK